MKKPTRLEYVATFIVLAVLLTVILAVSVVGINKRYSGYVDYIEYRATYGAPLNLTKVSDALTADNVSHSSSGLAITCWFGYRNNTNVTLDTWCWIEPAHDGTSTLVRIRCPATDEHKSAMRISGLDRHRAELEASMAFATSVIYNGTNFEPTEFSWYYGTGPHLGHYPRS
jgi:hypothetical protein